MKFLRDIPDTIVLNATNKRTSETEDKSGSDQKIHISKKSNQEAVRDIPFTLYSSRGRR